MINVCCVFYGDKYSVDYVQRLYNMVQRHLTIPHKFYCFTDHKNLFDKVYGNIIYKPFNKKDLLGWWNKLQLFNPEELEGITLYLDLDIVITKNIDCFATYGDDNSFCILNDFEPKVKEYNSSIMKFNNKTASIIWEEYMEKHFSILHVKFDDDIAAIIYKEYREKFSNLKYYFSDQQVITDVMYDKPELKLFPNEWSFSYKWYSRENPRFHILEQNYEEDKNAKIAVFHGRPNPHESNQEWVKNNWK
jgi:hypothetical protein